MSAATELLPRSNRSEASSCACDVPSYLLGERSPERAPAVAA